MCKLLGGNTLKDVLFFSLFSLSIGLSPQEQIEGENDMLAVDVYVHIISDTVEYNDLKGV